ncbi:MAG: GWxTD domain-containing protein [Gemmatimonadales bacterium]
MFRFLVRLSCGTMLLALVSASAAQAQSAETNRRIADGLLRQVVGDSSSKVDCTDYTDALNRLCLGLLAMREGARYRDPAVLGRADDHFKRLLPDHADWAPIWYGFGLIREARARSRIHAIEGPLQPPGVSNVAGAGHALVHFISLDTTFLPAFEALARLPVPPEGVSQLAERAELLLRWRLRVDLPPASRLAIGRVMLAMGPPDTAVATLFEALASGSDSGVTYLDLARALYQAGRSEGGQAALFAGSTRSLTVESNRRYRAELAWVANNKELAEWDSLPRDQRSQWLIQFWNDRDARDGLKPGERLIEHYHRIEYAMEHFRMIEAYDGRHRGRSVGMAGDRLRAANPSFNAGIDPTVSRFELLRTSPDMWLDNGRERLIMPTRAAEDKFNTTLGANSVMTEFFDGDLLFDDRGLIWIRHGEPDVRKMTSGGLGYEAWHYQRGRATPLVLFFGEADFDGIAGASMLIPTIAGADGEALDQLCGALDGTCDRLQVTGAIGQGSVGGAPRDGRLTNGRLPPAELIARERERGRVMTLEAISTDGAPVAFKRPMTPIVQLYGLRHLSDGSSRLLALFSIPASQMVADSTDARGRSYYNVHFRAVLTDQLTGDIVDGDGARQLVRSTPFAKAEFFSGVIDFTLPGGNQRVVLRLSQHDGGGAEARAAAVRVPAGSGALELSDLVLGRDGSGVRWNSGAQMVSLNPLNAFRRSERAELYYQVSGQKPGESYQTVLEIFKSSDEKQPARISLAFRETATKAAGEVLRTVDLRNLEPGSYRLRVTVRGTNTETDRSATLNVVN